MKTSSLILLCSLWLTACDVATTSIAPEPIDLGAAQSLPVGNTPENVDVLLTTRIAGEITTYNNVDSSSEVTVGVRGTLIASQLQENGEFELELPRTDEPRTLILDISGSSVMDKSVQIEVPAFAELVSVDTTLSGRSSPIAFNLEAGGELMNAASPTRTRVTIPPNAFQFSDGTIAVGDAEVSITEIDIQDLYGESAWAPNLVGIPEGMTEPGALITFGMSDFHFTQNGRQLQLRPGVEATIDIDLISPYVITDDSIFPVEANDGDRMPLWHYDTEDMVWKEEGEATIVADNQSASGFRGTGNVSHFSTWNLDRLTPCMQIEVVIHLVDETGAQRNNLKVASYTTTARIPLDEGPSWHNDPLWSNTVHMNSHKNQIKVLANLENRQQSINNSSIVTGFTTMEMILEKLVVTGKGQILDNPIMLRKIFFDYNGDNSIVFTIPVDENGVPTSNTGVESVNMAAETPAPIIFPIPTKSAFVEVQLVDFAQQPRTDLTLVSYKVTAQSDAGWVNHQDLTPESNAMTVQANNQEIIDSGQTVTMNLSLDEVVIEGMGAIDTLFKVTKSKVFYTYDNNDTIILLVGIVDEMTEDYLPQDQ